MQPFIESLSSLEYRITLKVSVPDLEKEVQVQLRHATRTAKIPGFRPGRAPIDFVKQSQGSSIRAAVLERLIDQELKKIIEDAKLHIASVPVLELVNKDFSESSVMIFHATFEIYPKVSIPDLSNLSIKQYKTQITDSDIEKTLENLRRQYATFQVRKDRPAKDGDRINADIIRTIHEKVSTEKEKEIRGFSFFLGESEKNIPIEFEIAAKGMKFGETKIFSVILPSNNDKNEKIARKPVEFKMTINEIAERILPNLDDEFAKTLGQTGDIEKLKCVIRKSVEREIKTRLFKYTKNSVMDALANAAIFDVPKTLINHEMQKYITDFKEKMKSRNIRNNDTISDSDKKILLEKAERHVRIRLLVSELVEKEKIIVKPEQVRIRIEEIAQDYENPEQVIRQYLKNRKKNKDIEMMILEEHVINYILDSANIEEEFISFDKLISVNA